MTEADTIADDVSRLAAAVAGVSGRVRERVVIRASGRQRGSVVCDSGRVRERVIVRVSGRQRRQRVNPRRS